MKIIMMALTSLSLLTLVKGSPVSVGGDDTYEILECNTSKLIINKSINCDPRDKVYVISGFSVMVTTKVCKALKFPYMHTNLSHLFSSFLNK